MQIWRFVSAWVCGPCESVYPLILDLTKDCTGCSDQQKYYRTVCTLLCFLPLVWIWLFSEIRVFFKLNGLKWGKGGGGGKRDDRRFFVHLFRRSCILSAWSEIRLNLPVLVYHQGWQGAVLTQERRSTLADQIKAIPAPRRHTHQPWPWDSDVVICRFLQHPTSLTESAAESSADVVSQPHGGQDSPGLWELLCFLNGILKTFPDIDASVTSL